MNLSALLRSSGFSSACSAMISLLAVCRVRLFLLSLQEENRTNATISDRIEVGLMFIIVRLCSVNIKEADRYKYDQPL